MQSLSMENSLVTVGGERDTSLKSSMKSDNTRRVMAPTPTKRTPPPWSSAISLVGRMLCKICNHMHPGGTMGPGNCTCCQNDRRTMAGSDTVEVAKFRLRVASNLTGLRISISSGPSGGAFSFEQDELPNDGKGSGYKFKIKTFISKLAQWRTS